MSRRALLLAACVLLAPAVAGLGLVLYALREGVANRVNFERVEPGTSRGRVEQLLGGPGELAEVLSAEAPVVIDELDGVFDRVVYVPYRGGQAAVPARSAECRSAAFWLGASGDPPAVFVVLFGPDGRVVNGAAYGAAPAGLLDRLRHALRW